MCYQCYIFVIFCRCGRIGRIGSPKDGRVINFISRPLEIVMTNKIEFAARKMKPIPMADLLRNNPKKETEFLKHTTTVKDDGDVQSTTDDRHQRSNDEEFPSIVPH